MAAENFEGGQHRDGKNDPRNAPHETPENEGKQNHDRIKGEGPAHYPGSNEIPFQSCEGEIDGRKDQGVAEARKAEDSSECNAGDPGEGAEIWNKVEQGYHDAPHRRIG